MIPTTTPPATTARPRQPAQRQANSRPSPTAPAPAAPRPAAAPKSRPPDGKLGLGPIRELLESKVDAIQRVIPSDIPLTAKSIVGNALRLIWKDNLLKCCTPVSVLDAVLATAALGLDFVGDQAILIPYSFKVENPDTREKVHSHWEARFMAMYKGYITLAGRHSYIMDCQEVCEQDGIDVRLGTENQIIHTPSFRGRGKPIGAYCVVRDKDKFPVHIAMIHEEEIAQLAQNTPAWRAYPGQMLSKSACKRGFKWIPKTAPVLTLLDEIDRRTDNGEDIHGLVDPDNPNPESPAQ